MALKAAFAVLPPAPPQVAIPLQLSARLAAYAKLAATAQAFGGFGRLLPALELLARLELPSLGDGIGALATLSLLLGLRTSIAAVPTTRLDGAGVALSKRPPSKRCTGTPSITF